MVTLPELDSYSDNAKTSLALYSPIFNHYQNHLNRDSKTFEDEIRKKKHFYWLQCALATFTDQVSPEDVCLFWSNKTDELLKEVWNHVQLPEQDLCLLLFGKLGSFELNLSSDIDIVFVKANTLNDPLVQSGVKKFIKILNENTPFGFTYRVDLKLRPGGEFSPLVPNKTNFYNFYDEYLEAWHRLSFIRVRSLFPSEILSQDLTSYCKKRCFPKRLDFSVLEEIKNVRSKIAFQWRKASEPFDIKLHPGGIRDIELYLHSLQVIYGGRDKSIQVAPISSAINTLQRVDALKKEEALFFHDFYWRLRKLENLIHIKEDQHTYLVQDRDYKELKKFNFTEEELVKGFNKSEEIIGHFFRTPSRNAPKSNPLDRKLSPPSKKAIDEIKNLKSASIKKQGIESLKDQILSSYIGKVQEISIDEDLAIQIFKDFIFSIKSKTSIFYLLERHPNLIDTLAWLFSISPFIGQLLTRRPELIDSFALGQVVIDDNDDIESLWDSLVDYKLLGQLTAVVDLMKNPDSESYFIHLSDQADLIVNHLIRFLTTELEAEKLEVLTLGKWSGKELGIRSDLDFVFLSESEPTSKQVRVARRIITLLTSRSNAGRLYDIDLRLKPNESAGPLILHKSAFLDFVKNQSQPWQKQAYLRSRLCGTDSFFLKSRFADLKLNPEELTELDAIHKKLLTPVTASNIDLKFCPGGLIETEFVIQKMILSKDVVPEFTSTLSLIELIAADESTKMKLKTNYRFLRRLEQVFQITNDSSSTKVGVNSNNLGRVSKMLRVESVFKSLQQVINEQQQILKNLT